MSQTAFLMMPEQEVVSLDTDEIQKEVEALGFTNVLPFDSYQSEKEGLLVVWQVNPHTSFTDEVAQKLVGSEGCICYMGACPICNVRVYRIEHPFNHDENSGIICSCPDTP